MTSSPDNSFAKKRILITRDAVSNSELEAELRQLGSEVVNWPCFETVSLLSQSEMAAAFDKLKLQDWLIFTSQNSVKYFLEGCDSFHLSLGAFSNCKMAAVGSETAQAIQTAGLTVHLVPPVFSQVGLSECNAFTQTQGLKITILQAKDGRNDFAMKFGSEHHIQSLPLYENRLLTQPSVRVEALLKNGIDWIMFYSPSAVKGFAAHFTIEQLKLVFQTAVPIVIGNTTLASLKNLPVTRYIIAKEATHSGMIQALYQKTPSQSSAKGAKPKAHHEIPN